MRAAIVRRLGHPPRPGNREDPQRRPGQALVRVLAAPVNPVDLSIAAGRFYAGSPDVPYVPGGEGVGEVLEADAIAPGTRVRFEGPEAMAELVAVSEAALVELPAIDDGLAAGLGVAGLAAWLALTWRAQLAPGETVLVLGASGAVGQIAVQAARALGAGRVVAAARSPAGRTRARHLGADAVVEIDGGPIQELAERLREAARDPVDVIIDPLWGPPAAAAAQAAGFRARLVNLGQSAGAQSPLTSAAVRGKLLSVLGHANAAAPPEVRRAAYLEMVGLAADGRLELEIERHGLEQVAHAWERQASSPHVKLIIDPRR